MPLLQNQIPQDYICPLTLLIMSDPVIAPDGITYEREAIENWLKNNATSPINRMVFPSKLVYPNLMLKNMIGDFLTSRPDLAYSGEVYLPTAIKQRAINILNSNKKKGSFSFSFSFSYGEIIDNENKNEFINLINKYPSLLIEIIDNENKTGFYYAFKYELEEIIDSYLAKFDTNILKKCYLDNAKVNTYAINKIEKNQLTVEHLNKLLLLGSELEPRVAKVAYRRNRLDIIDYLLEHNLKELFFSSYDYESDEIITRQNLYDGKVNLIWLMFSSNDQKYLNLLKKYNLINQPVLYITSDHYRSQKIQGNMLELNWSQYYVLFSSSSPQQILALINLGADLTIKDQFGFSLLHYAVLNPASSQEILAEIIKNGVSLFEKNYLGDTALHLAAYLGYLEKVEWFIKQGMSVDIPNFQGYTPLHYAAYARHSKVVNLLLNNGANPNHRAFTGNTPLHAIAITHQLPLISSTGNHLFFQTTHQPKNKFVLHSAIESQDYNKVKHILTTSSDNELKKLFDLRNLQGLKPLELAFISNNILLFNLVADEDKKIMNRDYSDEWNDISFFDITCHYPIKDEMLAHIFNDDQFMGEEDNLAEWFHLSILLANKQIFDLLLKTKGNGIVTLATNEHDSSLEAAVRQIDSYFLSRIIEAYHLLPSSLNKPLALVVSNKYPASLLVLACESGNIQAVSLLLKEGFVRFINEVDEDGLTALEAAVCARHPELIKLLITQGAKLFPINLMEASDSALYRAIERNYVEVIDYLLEYIEDVEENLLFLIEAFSLALNTENYGAIKLFSRYCHSLVLYAYQSNQEELEGKNYFLSACIQENDANTVMLLLELWPEMIHYEQVYAQNNLISLSVKANNLPLIQYLLSKGANLNLPDYQAQGSPLYLALKYRNSKIATFLWQQGADLEMLSHDLSKHRKDIIPLLTNELPMAEKIAKIIDYLINSYEISDNEDEMSIDRNEVKYPFTGSMQSYKDIFTSLIAQGGKLSIVNNENLTPFDYAKNEDEELAEQLLQNIQLTSQPINPVFLDIIDSMRRELTELRLQSNRNSSVPTTIPAVIRKP